jgi:hypothetical protein
MNTKVIPCDDPDSAFDKWWDEYHITNDLIEPKQVACDAYAAGMTDPMVDKTPENNPHLIPLSGTL